MSDPIKWRRDFGNYAYIARSTSSLTFEGSNFLTAQEMYKPIDCRMHASDEALCRGTRVPETLKDIEKKFIINFNRIIRQKYSSLIQKFYFEPLSFGN